MGGMQDTREEIQNENNVKLWW